MVVTKYLINKFALLSTTTIPYIQCIFRYNSTAADKLREELNELKKTFQNDIRPVWKKEFISLYCFLPW